MPKKKTDPLKPSLTVLSKLGSVFVHAQEFLSPAGHEFDKVALEQLFADPDLVEWVKEMGPYLPQKRS